jgi:membrane protease YdiL (CAAX protease family)
LAQIGLAIPVGIIITVFKRVGQSADIFTEYPVLLGMINLIALGFGSWMGFKKTKVDFRQVFPLRPISLSLLIPIGLSVAGLHILLSDLDNLLRFILRWPSSSGEFILHVVQNQYVWKPIFLLMLVAPFSEEFLFRGLVFTGYLNNYSFKKAMWVSALFFGLFHLNVYQFPVALITGLFFAWLVYRTNSLWPSLFAHALLNGLPILIVRTINVQIPGYSGPQAAFQPWWFNACGVVLILLGVGFFWLFRKKLQNPSQLLRPQLPEESDGETAPLETENSPRRFNYQGAIVLGSGIMALLILVFIFVYLGINIGRHLNNQDLLLIGLVFIFGLLGCLTGVGFGITALIKKRSRGVAWTGLILNSIYLIFTVLVIILMIRERSF